MKSFNSLKNAHSEPNIKIKDSRYSATGYENLLAGSKILLLLNFDFDINKFWFHYFNSF